MNLSTTILGSSAVKALQATSSAWVLEVGSDRFTRAQLASVGCYNFHAARLLTAVLGETNVKHLADLYARVAPSDLALPHLGVISLAVLGAAFEVKGIGGDVPLESWVQRHTPEAAMVSFPTLKRRELAEHAKDRKRRRTRRRAA